MLNTGFSCSSSVVDDPSREKSAKTVRLLDSELSKDLLCLFGIVLLSSGCFFWRLGHGSLADWDEAIYAVISREMVRSGDWLTMQFIEKPWLEKPPLLMWLTALLFKCFGAHEVTARAVSALSSVALTSTTFLLGKSLRNRLVGVLSALVLLTSLQFVRQAQFGTTDMLLTLFIYGALYAYWLCQQGSVKYWYLVCVCCGLALMTKGAGGLVAPGMIGVLALQDGLLGSMLKTKHFWIGFALLLLIVAPWHILMFLRYGHIFIEQYLVHHVFERTTSVLDQHSHNRWYYVDILQKGFFPWFYLVPITLALGIREAVLGDRKVRSLLLVVIVVFGGYTLVQTGLPWYIMPIYPALALLLAWMLVHAFDSASSVAFSALLLGAFLLCLQGFPKLTLIASAAALSLAGVALLRMREPFVQLACSAAVLAFALTGLRQLRPLYQRSDSSVARLSRMAANGISSKDAAPRPLLVVPAEVVPSARYYCDCSIDGIENIESLRSMKYPLQVIVARKELDDLSKFYNTMVQGEDGPLLLVLVQQPTQP